MRIPIFFGLRFFGHLDQEDGSQIATKFFYLQFLPLFPLGTWQLYGEQGRKVDFSFKSFFAAVFKAWGFVAACILAAVGLGGGTWGKRHPELPVITLIALLLFLAVYASWFFLGHLHRGTARKVIVPLMTLSTVGVLLYGSFINIADAARSVDYDSFAGGRSPPADIPMSMEMLQKMDGKSEVTFEEVTSASQLEPGDMVEVSVPGGYAIGMVESATGEKVGIKTKSGDGTYYVSPDVLTLVHMPEKPPPPAPVPTLEVKPASAVAKPAPKKKTKTR